MQGVNYKVTMAMCGLLTPSFRNAILGVCKCVEMREACLGFVHFRIPQKTPCPAVSAEPFLLVPSASFLASPIEGRV